MKKIIYSITAVLFFYNALQAQQFIDKAVIEYEVKTSIKKTMMNSSWTEMLKENMPEFKTGYYNFTFADNKSIYQFNHWDEKGKVPPFMRESDEENKWYFNFETGQFNMQKNIVGTNFVIVDSVPKIHWKLTNENREIAGFNCRKAIGKIMDSVFVFAFYTDEITIPGGPCSINGLPGMILGLTIPRMYTSYLATKVSLSGADAAAIKPATAKKIYTNSSFKTLIEERLKEWYTWGDDEEENKRQKNLALWNIYL